MVILLWFAICATTYYYVASISIYSLQESQMSFQTQFGLDTRREWQVQLEDKLISFKLLTLSQTPTRCCPRGMMIGAH